MPPCPRARCYGNRRPGGAGRFAVGLSRLGEAGGGESEALQADPLEAKRALEGEVSRPQGGLHLQLLLPESIVLFRTQQPRGQPCS